MISYDSVEVLAQFSARRNIAYTLLSDAGSKIISAFGVAGDYPKGSAYSGVAHPIVMVVDAAGLVRHRFSAKDPYFRPPVDAVLKALGQTSALPGAGAAASADK